MCFVKTFNRHCSEDFWRQSFMYKHLAQQLKSKQQLLEQHDVMVDALDLAVKLVVGLLKHSGPKDA